jgi:hypothetical protein
MQFLNDSKTAVGLAHKKPMGTELDCQSPPFSIEHFRKEKFHDAYQ